MAKMWPEKIPAEIELNPQRSGECKTFRRLESVLEDPFVVFYSRPWLGRKPNGEETDGECDFVIAHPDLGMLALEVKGGRISYDPSIEQWMTRDRWGYNHIIKDPVYQARTSKHQILKKLNKSRIWNSRRISAHHGIVFPDSEGLGVDMRADMPQEIFCFLDEFEGDFRNWIIQRFGDTDIPGSRVMPLGEDGIKALENLLAMPFHLHVPFGHILAEDDKVLQILTQQQFHILKAIEKIARASISGGAGTGKTVLAMEEAIRHAETGEHVLLSCFNRPLAEEMRRRLSKFDGITVLTFHELCFQAIKNTGILLPENIPREQLYREMYPDCFTKALDLLPEFRFDTIIVDEGQDFLPLWLTALDDALVSREKGKIRIFYDSNQRLYGNTEKTLAEFELVPILLSLNIRNTQHIHQITQHYYKGYPIESIGPSGKDIDLIPSDSVENTRREIEILISQLITKERVNPAHIAVLAGSQNLIHEIAPSGYLAGKECQTCDIPAEDKIILDTIRRFKGLESPIVILAVTSDVMCNDELLYVALSRARTHLVLIGEQGYLNEIKNRKD